MIKYLTIAGQAFLYCAQNREIQHPLPPIAKSLSRREMQCIYWASQGKTTLETATLLNISSNTVRAYIDSARRSLHASTIAHAVAIAINNDLLPFFIKDSDAWSP